MCSALAQTVLFKPPFVLSPPAVYCSFNLHPIRTNIGAVVLARSRLSVVGDEQKKGSERNFKGGLKPPSFFSLARLLFRSSPTTESLEQAIVVPTSHAHNILPTMWRPYFISTHVIQLAFKSNLFHESSLQVLLLIISYTQSTPGAHLRRAQTPFAHYY